MWNWIERSRAWAMRKNWISTTPSVQIRSLVHRHTCAGLTFEDQVVPWNADTLVVEAVLQCDSRWQLYQGDLTLRLDSGAAFTATSLERVAGSTFKATFALVVPPATVVAQVFVRQWSLGQLTLSILRERQFLDGLQCSSPTVHVLMDGRQVACRAFVATQARGLSASMVVRSPWPLSPLLNQALRVAVFDEHGKLIGEDAVVVTGSQVVGREMLVLANPPIPRRRGTWRLDWLLNRECICSHEVEGISLPKFLAALKVSDARFSILDDNDDSRLSRNLTELGPIERASPRFAVQSEFPGAAGIVRFRTTATKKGLLAELRLTEQVTLITDCPTTLMPANMSQQVLQEIHDFAIFAGRKCLATLETLPTPHARFDGEGSFSQVESVAWDGRAEEELNERLNALMKLDDSAAS
jgi:hypothetical protein